VAQPLDEGELRYGQGSRLRAPEGGLLQGVVKSYDPGTAEGVLMRDTDRSEYDLSPDALNGSVFRMLRQGQRVVFDLDAEGRATRVRLGSEVDMGTPAAPGGSAERTA
jgi:CspA family cold shock protein